MDMVQRQDLSWQEVSELIAVGGSGEHIGLRMKEWRKERGWTLKRLAEEMDLGPLKAGMNESSLWKIENRGQGGRRSISIDEAITIARVFDKTLAEVLLPDDALSNVAGWRQVLDAASALNQVREAWQAYEVALSAAQASAQQSDFIRSRLADAREVEHARWLALHKRPWQKYKVAQIEQDRPEPHDDEFEAWVARGGTSPLIAAIDDVIAGREAAHDGWASGRLVTALIEQQEENDDE